MAEKLKEYCTVISGYAFKSKDLSEGTDIPVIKIGNISNGKNVVIDDSTQYVNEEFLSVDEKYHIKNGDILISLTGSHMNQPNSMVGRCCRNLDDTIYLLNQRAGKIIPNKSVDKDFLYYVFRLPSIQYAIANRAYGGANQVNVSPKDVMGIKFDIPDIEIQRKSADILSAYDKLIENNNKRIRLLEQMAENLYKEWFVRFRFPGYEDVEFEDGMPKGWVREKIGLHYNTCSGGTPSRTHKAKSALISWFEENIPMSFNEDSDIEAELEKYYSASLKTYKDTFLRCMRSYQDASSIDLGLIDNAYGNLDFIISNHSIRKYAYNNIFDKMRKFVYQFREEAYHFDLLNDGKGNFAVCVSKVVDLNKLFFAAKDVKAHGYVNTLVYQTAFDEIESELEKFRCKIYKTKYVPVKSSPISGMMRYFGEDSETKGTDE